VLPKGVDPLARDVRDGDDGNADRDAFDLEQRVGDVRVQVRLGEDDHRLRAALPRRRQVPLEPAEAEVLVQPVQQQHDVDVRGEHLLERFLERLLPRDRGPSGQNGLDGAATFAGTRPNRDPVADRRHRRPDLDIVEQPARRLRAQLAGRGPDDVHAAVLRGDPSGNQVVVVEPLELGLPLLVPAELLDGRRIEQRKSPLVCESGMRKTPRLARPELTRLGSTGAKPLLAVPTSGCVGFASASVCDDRSTRWN
jgi:hypothetical protein